MNIPSPPEVSRRSAHRPDDGLGHFAGADGGGVVAVGLHVVGDGLALGDDLGDGAFEPRRGPRLAPEDHRGR